MEPLNRQERSIAFWKFLGVYLLIVAIPLLAFYFFLEIPSGAVREENEKLKAIIREQQLLLDKVDKIAGETKILETNDIAYRKIQDEEEKGKMKNQIQENTSTIQALVLDIKKDSANLVAAENKRISKDVISTSDALLTYRNTIESLRGQLERTGNYNKDLENKEQEIAGLKNQIATLTVLLATKGSGGGGGGGGGGGNAKELEQLNKDLKACEARLADCQAKVNVPVANNSSSNDETIADLRISFQLAKADCNYQLGDEVKEPKQRRKYYNLALQLYKEIYQNVKKEPTKGDVKTKMDEVEKKAKKVSSGDF